MISLVVNYQERSSVGNTCVVARTATVPCASCLTCGPSEIDAVAAMATTCSPTSRCQSGTANYQVRASGGSTCVVKTAKVSCASCSAVKRTQSSMICPSTRTNECSMAQRGLVKWAWYGIGCEQDRSTFFLPIQEEVLRELKVGFSNSFRGLRRMEVSWSPVPMKNYA